jgi:hypothetical protein
VSCVLWRPAAGLHDLESSVFGVWKGGGGDSRHGRLYLLALAQNSTPPAPSRHVSTHSPKREYITHDVRIPCRVQGSFMASHSAPAPESTAMQQHR